MGETELGLALNRICSTDRWSYAVFWSFDQRNSMLLTLEDIWHEEQLGLVATNMFQQVYMLGEGVIGTAAFTGKHRWIFSDPIGEWNSSMFQDNLEFEQQFSCGIKTVAVIPVHPHGVIQLGSTHKIWESLEFLADAKRSLCQVINGGGLVQKKAIPMSSSTDACHFNELFTSFISSADSDDWSLSAMHSNTHTNFTGKSYASIDKQPAYDTSYFSKSSCENSVLTSSEPRPTSDVREQGTQYPNYSDANMLESCRNKMEYGNRSSTFASNSSGIYPFDMDVQQLAQLLPMTEGELMENITSLPDFCDEHLKEDFTVDLPDISLVDDLFQWFDSSLENGTNGATTALNHNLLQSTGISTFPSNLVEVHKLVDDPIKTSVVSAESLITNVSHSRGQDKTVTLQNTKDRLFDSLGLDTGCAVGKTWDNIITEAHGSYSGGWNSLSTCTSKLATGSSDLPRKRLFWELGIEELLDSNSSATKSSIENHQSIASKRSKTELLSLENPIQLLDPCTSVNLTQPSCTVDRFPCKKETAPKSQVSSWIDDSYSTNIGGSILDLSHKSEEPAKTCKKRARPGESNRPRPKDRQQIQDRIKELRGIIPSGAKCSIDSLLDRTIKYMLFLQSVTKYADKLKETNKPKLIDQEDGVAENKKCTAERGGGGVTWAFKVGTTPMVCPVIVEDLSSPGQMLIEMLCEERGFFLEIADMIRSYGLTILKGVMEIREDKIWAQFVVEVKLNTNQNITRISVFLSLMELLQQANIDGTELANQPNNVMNSGVPPHMDSFQNPIIQSECAYMKSR